MGVVGLLLAAHFRGQAAHTSMDFFREHFNGMFHGGFYGCMEADDIISPKLWVRVGARVRVNYPAFD